MSNPQPLQQVYYQLRPYQLDLLSQVESLWSQGKRRVLMALPTGAGKTVIFSAITHKFTAKQLRVLVVVHREELLLQAVEKLCAVTGEKVGLIKAGYREDRSHLVQVASVQSLLRRQLPEADLLIIDEAHHSVSRSWTRLLEHYKDSYILGVTATPARIDGQGASFLVQQYPNLGIPELRECALFYTKDFPAAVAWATKYYENLVQEQKEAAAQKARQAQLERLTEEVNRASTWAEILNVINSYSHIFNPQEVISRLPVEQQVRISQLRQEERKRSTVAAVVSSLSWDAVTLALNKGGFLLADILDFLPFSEQARLVELAIPSDSKARRFSEDEENQTLPRQNFVFRFEKLYYWRLIQLSQNHKPIWLYYKLIEYHPQPTFEELSECARLLGYKQGWVDRKWRELYPDDKYFGSPDFFSQTYYSTSVVPQVVSSGYEDLDPDDCYGWDALDDEVYSFELERAESELIWYQQQFDAPNA